MTIAIHSIYKSLIRVTELNQCLGRYAIPKKHLMQAVNLLEAILPPGHPKLVKHYEEIQNIKEDHDD